MHVTRSYVSRACNSVTDSLRSCLSFPSYPVDCVARKRQREPLRASYRGLPPHGIRLSPHNRLALRLRHPELPTNCVRSHLLVGLKRTSTGPSVALPSAV
jgi:hypothetical protein